MRKANVYMHDKLAGKLEENEEGYFFKYDSAYLNADQAEPISLTLPLSNETYHSDVLFAFFDGLIPEGWLLEIASKNWKLSEKDRMGLLLACCRDCIGAASIIEQKDD
jgi:serine/threonine-protein kinase HipA